MYTELLNDYLDPQVLHELDLEVHHLHGEPERGQLGGVEAAHELLLLVHGDVAVAQAGQERGAGDGGGAAAEKGDLLPRFFCT